MNQKAGVDLYQSLSDCISNSCRPSRHIQLDKNIAQVTIDRAWTDDKRLGNFTIHMAFGNQTQNFEFALRKSEFKLISAWLLLHNGA